MSDGPPRCYIVGGLFILENSLLFKFTILLRPLNTPSTILLYDEDEHDGYT